MKITKKQLKQIIEEELGKVFKESRYGEKDPLHPRYGGDKPFKHAPADPEPEPLVTKIKYSLEPYIIKHRDTGKVFKHSAPSAKEAEKNLWHKAPPGTYDVYDEYAREKVLHTFEKK